MKNDGYGKPISVTLKFDYEQGEAVVPESFKQQAINEPNIAMADFLQDSIGELTRLYNKVLAARND